MNERPRLYDMNNPDAVRRRFNLPDIYTKVDGDTKRFLLEGKIGELRDSIRRAPIYNTNNRIVQYWTDELKALNNFYNKTKILNIPMYLYGKYTPQLDLILEKDPREYSRKYNKIMGVDQGNPGYMNEEGYLNY